MPALPLALRETTNHGCSCSQSRTADQMCRQQSRVLLTAEEQLAAEESLSIYCKPVELYNILQRRAVRNPSFLQRCLRYKIHAKRKRRIQITVSLLRSLNAELEQQTIFPLYVMLARPMSEIENAEQSSVYQLSRPCLLTDFSEFSEKDQAEACFIIPEIKKLVNDAQVNNLTILIISKGGSSENHILKENEGFSPELEGRCLWGNVPVDTICFSLEKCVSLCLGHQADMLSSVVMQPGFLESKFLVRNDCIFFRSQSTDVKSTFQVQVSICAQEVGADDATFDLYPYGGVPMSPLPCIVRLRSGNVLFNYRYNNNTLQKTEVTEDFSCPFCLVKCSSFKGLGYHLNSSHDLFNFEFWATDEYQAVNVSVRTDIWRTEVLSDGVDPRLQTFSLCSKFRKRRSRSLVQSTSHVHPHVLESGSNEAALEGSHEDCQNKVNGACSSQRPFAYTTDASLTNGCNDGSSDKGERKNHKSLFSETHLLSARNKSESFGSQNRHAVECVELMSSSPDTSGFCAATAQASTSNDFAQQLSGANLVQQNMLQFAKMQKISDERADPRNRSLLTKRQFFHSHRAQPMALEQVFSDKDSEDEIDDDIADFEDRRMLDDFVDVTNDEKQIMHLWNSFVRKQRVLADGHIPWACEALSQLHGQDLVRTPALLWCWRLFMIKLWNHSLIDARSINNCSLILEKYKSEVSGSKDS